jgi:hypothetical protein
MIIEMHGIASLFFIHKKQFPRLNYISIFLNKIATNKSAPGVRQEGKNRVE